VDGELRQDGSTEDMIDRLGRQRRRIGQA